MGASLANGGNPYGESFKARYSRTPNQGVGAEMIAEQWGFSRTQLDEFSLRSHEKRRRRTGDAGAFKDQIVGIKTKDADGNDTVVLEDGGIRRGGTVESMAKIKPAFKGRRRDPRR